MQTKIFGLKIHLVKYKSKLNALVTMNLLKDKAEGTSTVGMYMLDAQFLETSHTGLLQVQFSDPKFLSHYLNTGLKCLGMGPQYLCKHLNTRLWNAAPLDD